jgi:HD-GYP domain-containing protein (c-di-GMP phosphodiesterase class II)
MPPLPARVAPAAERADRLALAEVVRSRKYAVAARLLAVSVRRVESNVGLELTALSFAEHFADSLANGNWSTLLSWVDAVCDKYAHLAGITRLMSAGTWTIAAILDELGASSANRGSEWSAVAEDIESVTARQRAGNAAAATDTLDEIDVALGEFVGRLEAADSLTAEHSRAVGVWCARIGKRMALSPAETTHIARCGLIHDIGKMTTPPEILSAPRRLTALETNLMRRHAEDGAAIISAIPLLARHTPAVLGHHERLDGSGYPAGLSLTRIPLAARIVAVADSFNAMIGNRPYRFPMRPTAALEELRRHAGTQFDPDVVDAMNDVLTKRS